MEQLKQFKLQEYVTGVDTAALSVSIGMAINASEVCSLTRQETQAIVLALIETQANVDVAKVHAGLKEHLKVSDKAFDLTADLLVRVKKNRKNEVNQLFKIIKDIYFFNDFIQADLPTRLKHYKKAFDIYYIKHRYGTKSLSLWLESFNLFLRSYNHQSRWGSIYSFTNNHPEKIKAIVLALKEHLHWLD